MNPDFIVYYAEDDADDLYIFKEAFEGYPEVGIRHFPNGEELLEQLAVEPRSDWPCVILLDLNMPQLDGRETLVRLRRNETWKSIPVFLFTTSNSIIDLTFAQRWDVELITKPLLFDGMQEVARRIVGHCRARMSR